VCVCGTTNLYQPNTFAPAKRAVAALPITSAFDNNNWLLIELGNYALNLQSIQDEGRVPATVCHRAGVPRWRHRHAGWQES
jgi:hypothetical protein